MKRVPEDGGGGVLNFNHRWDCFVIHRYAGGATFPEETVVGALAPWGNQSIINVRDVAAAADDDGRTGRVERVHLAIMSCEKYYYLDTATNTCARQARCVHFLTWRMTWTIRVNTRDRGGWGGLTADGRRMNDGWRLTADGRWMETDDGFCVCF